ncbi:sulfate ABC transporter permease subunit CysT [Kerstersia similis]|uniref:sulfate ABC transporter permease subunit CysT n=1 Tax=Kerstersia similis TaxID=206505 RepID=UPI0039F0340B
MLPKFFNRPPSLPGFGLSFGISVLYLSLIILLPIAGLLIYASGMSWAEYWRAISDPRVVASYRVTLYGAFLSTVFATLFGLLLSWIIVRYEFPGKRLLDALVDLPFALPTAVAGLTLALLLSPPGWLGQYFSAWGIKVAYAFPGLVIAMVFTSLPFVVRSVQPVLADVGPEYEEAARTLGARDGQILRRVILPALLPAIMTGASQAFIRSLGEFGAVVMIAGNLPFRTEITSLMIFMRQAENNYPAAAAIATVVLFASLLLLFGLRMAQKWLLPWYRTEV